MTVRVTNIQHFCLHDGPGIRTTVFLKGCNLICPWCSNPENISYNLEEYDTNGVFGYDISLDDLKEEILNDRVFYSMNNGGVTFSGGEPLLQIEELEPLLKELKDESINICFETALFTSKNSVETLIKYVDELFVDMKILNPVECKNILHGDIKKYKDNLEFLLENIDDVTFRIPLCEEYTLKKENVDLILELLRQYPKQKVEIFKIHNLGENKYLKLGKNVPEFRNIEDDRLNKLYDEINEISEECEIIKI